jgi:hypothetical protein
VFLSQTTSHALPHSSHLPAAILDIQQHATCLRAYSIHIRAGQLAVDDLTTHQHGTPSHAYLTHALEPYTTRLLRLALPFRQYRPAQQHYASKSRSVCTLRPLLFGVFLRIVLA